MEGTEKLTMIVKEIRYAVSQGENSPIVYLTETTMLPSLAKLLDESFLQYPELQNEAAWILSNVASSESSHTKFVVKELNGINRFLFLLNRSSSLGVKISVNHKKLIALSDSRHFDTRHYGD